MKNWMNNIAWKEWIKSFLIAVFIIIFFRNFIFRVYVVESDSMEAGVRHGDFVYVNLLAYGPRFPMTPVCIPFTDIYSSAFTLGYARIPGYASPVYHDVIMLNDPSQKGPIDRRETMIKRLVGLPGDTLQVKNDSVFVNGKFMPAPPTITHDFVITLKKNVSPGQVSCDWKIPPLHPLLGADYIATLSDEKFRAAKQSAYIVNIVRLAPMDDENLDFSLGLQGENRNNFGPVIIPRKGMKISLQMNFMYGNAIRYHEGKQVRMAQGRILIEGNDAGLYEFTQDYYFVMGDNRDNSVDSRNFGFVPRSHIIGRAGFIVFSYDKTGDEGIRWSRFFKMVR